MQVTISVVPVPGLADKPGSLMQPVPAAIDLETSNEFYGPSGVSGESAAGRSDLQTQPFLARHLHQLPGSERRMPGIQQVVFFAQHVGAVTRTHEAFGGIRRGTAVEESTTAVIERATAAAGTG